MKPSIQLVNVSKRYRIGHSVPNLRSLLTGWRNNGGDKYHWALKDLNFELKPGESLGIIGPNGAGKTTTLKLLSRVTYPTSGKIVVNGRFAALIELGAGFHPDLTGRENIYLNGTILGMRRTEIKSRFVFEVLCLKITARVVYTNALKQLFTRLNLLYYRC